MSNHLRYVMSPTERDQIIAALRSAPVSAPATYTEVCRNEKCPRGGIPVEILFPDSPVPDATVSEPVAWISWFNGNCDATVRKDRVEDWKRLGRKIGPLYTSPQEVDREATVSTDAISFPRWWITQLRDNLMKATLPSGPLGDWAFIFREQLNDALNRPSAPVSARDAVIEAINSYVYDQASDPPFTLEKYRAGILKAAIRSLTGARP